MKSPSTGYSVKPTAGIPLGPRYRRDFAAAAFWEERVTTFVFVVVVIVHRPRPLNLATAWWGNLAVRGGNCRHHLHEQARDVANYFFRQQGYREVRPWLASSDTHAGERP